MPRTRKQLDAVAEAVLSGDTRPAPAARVRAYRVNRLRHGWLTLLKYTLNPVTRRLARSPVGPFSIIRHVGRRSGKRYETPIIVAPVSDGFVIELTYGPDVDWHKNVVAAGGCTIVRRGQSYVINQIVQVDTETGLAAFPPLQRLVLRLFRRTHFEKWTLQQEKS